MRDQVFGIESRIWDIFNKYGYRSGSTYGYLGMNRSISTVHVTGHNGYTPDPARIDRSISTAQVSGHNGYTPDPGRISRRISTAQVSGHKAIYPTTHSTLSILYHLFFSCSISYYSSRWFLSSRWLSKASDLLRTSKLSMNEPYWSPYFSFHILSSSFFSFFPPLHPYNGCWSNQEWDNSPLRQFIQKWGYPLGIKKGKIYCNKTTSTISKMG